MEDVHPLSAHPVDVRSLVEVMNQGHFPGEDVFHLRPDGPSELLRQLATLTLEDLIPGAPRFGLLEDDGDGRKRSTEFAREVLTWG